MIVNAGYRGKVGAATPKFTYTGQSNIRKDGVVELLTSGTLVFLEPKVIDVFMVGGGGGGGSSVPSSASEAGHGGGGGGFTRTIRKYGALANTSYVVTVGAGGTTAENAAVTSGGSSAFNGLTVKGGTGGNPATSSTAAGNGGSGGSGGGGGTMANSDGGVGGYNGGNGEAGGNNTSSGGVGQGFTTKEFGEETGKLYAGGGGGGRYIFGSAIISMGGSGGGGTGGWSGGISGTQAPAAGVANTGGGGGGGVKGGASYSVVGASGGSGIVCFRAAQELPELAGTWVLNERLYAPESTINQTIQFTAKESATATEQAYANFYSDTSALKFTRATGFTTTVYTYSSNTWNTKYKYLTFPVGATGSDEFRAWLASNATKQ